LDSSGGRRTSQTERIVIVFASHDHDVIVYRILHRSAIRQLRLKRISVVIYL